MTQINQRLKIPQSFEHAQAYKIGGLEKQLAAMERSLGVNVRRGEGTLQWAGASPLSETKEIEHGLGAKPSNILITLAVLVPLAGNNGLLTFGVSATSATVFKINGTYPTGSIPGAGSQLNFYWTAVL